MSAEDVKAEIAYQITEKGNTVTLYDPSITYNNEGDVSAYDCSSSSSTTVLYFSVRGDAVTVATEGFDISQQFRLYANITETIDEESIFKIGSDYYRVVSIEKPTVEDTEVFYSLVIAKMTEEEVQLIST